MQTVAIGHQIFIIEHLARNKLLAEEQHGFVPKRNCITTLLTVIEDWSALIEEEKTFVFNLHRLFESFDSVSHA